MTIAEVLTRKRWMRLAMPEDVEQSVALAKLLHPNSEHRQAVELEYLLNLLRNMQWERRPVKRRKRPERLSPSKEAKLSPEARQLALSEAGKRGTAVRNRADLDPEEKARRRAHCQSIASSGAQAQHASLSPGKRKEQSRRAAAASSRTANLEPSQRSEIARKAALARWGKR